MKVDEPAETDQAVVKRDLEYSSAVNDDGVFLLFVED